MGQGRGREASSKNGQPTSSNHAEKQDPDHLRQGHTHLPEAGAVRPGFPSERIHRRHRDRRTFEDTLRLNLSLRTAHRVLFVLKEFAARDADALYREVARIAWEELIPRRVPLRDLER